MCSINGEVVSKKGYFGRGPCLIKMVSKEKFLLENYESSFTKVLQTSSVTKVFLKRRVLQGLTKRKYFQIAWGHSCMG